jgi:hypothetical protein
MTFLFPPLPISQHGLPREDNAQGQGRFRVKCGISVHKPVNNVGIGEDGHKPQIRRIPACQGGRIPA